MIVTVRDLQEDSKENVIRLQTDAKSEFEKQVDETKQKIANLDEDAIDEFVRNKFKTLNNMFLERSNQLEKYVLSKKPKKPEKNPNETNEEYENKYKEYMAAYGLYREFITLSMSVINKLMNWLDELFNEIIQFFKNLWILIKAKAQDIATNVQNFVAKIAEKFNQLCNYLFG
ncbi:uncharacterized protein OCT59_029351 [Rhizophagus irregularis]|uniref:Uncharacterized protein n=4 Tax=Rhizophagus irregularis TaxID=588596 RepID=A0A915YP77_9GLOM|nr:hypothetical protein RirG_267570 [Rhizophagus irregularis DAOM 197198w]UZO09114.1 hypothetical protein OCT59_029351 [Rhizophagus irregularis]GBC40940.1 hypothetical protein GLOIN_2v1723994 [Rhizophagus irregularis DAOM 181602=DAOM 197198]CAB4481893.1 unnamed protein product [Rhizophagus irregularis]CAB5212915.1 unnamed protein product [Rhizophagus irregularis]